MLELPACRDEQFGVFTAAQASRSDLTRHQIQRLLTARRIIPLRRGVYIDRTQFASSNDDHRLCASAIAACLAWRGSVISDEAAALIHALPLMDARPTQPTLTFPADLGRHADGDRSVRLRVRSLPRSHVQDRRAWSITTPGRTVCDIARTHSLTTSLVLADAVLARRLATTEELCGIRDTTESSRGIVGLRRVLRHATRHAESPFETLARLHILESGFDVVPQVWAYDEQGSIGVGDLWVPKPWTFLEVDGDVKYDVSAPPTALVEEKRRQERLEAAGFGVARVSAREARDRALVLHRLATAARRGGIARWVTQPTGYVGPPPPWATRGSQIAVARPHG